MNNLFETSHLTKFNGFRKFLINYANQFSERRHIVAILGQKKGQNNYKYLKIRKRKPTCSKGIMKWMWIFNEINPTTLSFRCLNYFTKILFLFNHK